MMIFLLIDQRDDDEELQLLQHSNNATFVFCTVVANTALLDFVVPRLLTETLCLQHSWTNSHTWSCIFGLLAFCIWIQLYLSNFIHTYIYKYHIDWIRFICLSALCVIVLFMSFCVKLCCVITEECSRWINLKPSDFEEFSKNVVCPEWHASALEISQI